MSTYATNVARDGLSASHLLLLQSIPDGSSELFALQFVLTCRAK